MTSPPSPRTALLGLGSNLDRPLEHLRAAVAGLLPALGEASVSPVYRSSPEGGAAQPDYLNAVMRGSWTGTARALLALARATEEAAGRRRPYPGAPRTLDVDILFLGDAVMDEPELQIPHPRWAVRPFVVIPLLDVAPEWRDPASGRTARAVAQDRGWTAETLEEVASSQELLPLETR